jgi:hypothetical protein
MRERVAGKEREKERGRRRESIIYYISITRIEFLINRFISTLLYLGKASLFYIISYSIYYIYIVLYFI